MASDLGWLPGSTFRTIKNHRRGGHRTVPPSETLERLGPLAPSLGITRVANVTGLDRIGLPVFMVCRPNSRCLSVAQGKGVDPAAAKASGLMESIEQYHAENVVLPLKLASHSDLRRHHITADLDLVPRADIHTFHDDLKILWIEGRDLLRDVQVWLPYELVHLDFTAPLPPASGCFPMGTHGLASGNHFLEAVCHGICEVIERDAYALWRVHGEERQRQTRVDLSTVDDPIGRELIERYDAAGITVAVWEITSDIGVPAFRCLICDSEPNPWRPLPPAAGMGCHTSRDIALVRALTEAAQSRLTHISGARDDLFRRDASKVLEHQEEFLAKLEANSAKRNFLDVASYAGDTFEEDLRWLSARLTAGGFPQILVTDLTRTGLELAVVRVVIPGLESHAESLGYRPGPRLKAHLRQLTPGGTSV